jgi:glycosyltransferase involved in cell wall biosynthesis
LRNVDNAHVLVVPSWSHTREQPIRDTFFHEQTTAVQKLGVKTGVVCPDLRAVGEAKSHDWLERRFQITEADEDGIFTMRVLGWRVPLAKKLTRSLWVSQVQRLIQHYVHQCGVPDLIHAYCVHEAGVAALVAKQDWKIPYVITEHSTGYARGSMTDDMLTRARDVFSEAERIIVVSRALARDIRGYTGGRDIAVIPHPVDTEFFRPPLQRTADPFRFLFVGFLTEKRGVADLLRAFAAAFDSNENVRLEIGGDGELRAPLEALATELRLGPRVDFLGMLSPEQIRDAMWGANAVVTAARVESLDAVLMEAMSTGIPVIVTRCGGSEDFVTEEVGRVVDLDDGAGLQKTMREMVSSSESWLGAAASIRSYVEHSFGELAIAYRLTELYNSVIRTLDKPQ